MSVPSILLMGPSTWLERPVPPARPDPLTTRRELAALMRKAGAEVVVMEDEPDLSEETPFRKLTRLVETRDVRTFVLYWPFGARLLGLEVEVGSLLRALARGEIAPAQVVLLVEARALGVRLDGTWSLDEPGNRTRYHADLVAAGCRIRRWRTEETLQLHALDLAHQDASPERAA